MPCQWLKTGTTTVIVCGQWRLPRRPPLRCAVCNIPESMATMRLCDAPVGQGTCDRAICIDCAVHVEPNTDYCDQHAHLGAITRRSAG